jgi:hypothetical protein
MEPPSARLASRAVMRGFMELLLVDWGGYSPPAEPASLPESEVLMPLRRLSRPDSWLSSGSGVAAGSAVWLVAAESLGAGDSLAVCVGMGERVGAV